MKKEDKLNYKLSYIRECIKKGDKPLNLLNMYNIKGFENDNVKLYNEPCNTIVFKSGCALSILIRVKFNTLLGELEYATIIVDENFVSLPEEVKTFLIYHEVGHYKNNDLAKCSGRKYQALGRLFKLDSMEAGADLFAANIVSKESAIEALKYLKTKLPFLSSIEIGRRIKALERAVI